MIDDVRANYCIKLLIGYATKGLRLFEIDLIELLHRRQIKLVIVVKCLVDAKIAARREVTLGLGRRVIAAADVQEFEIAGLYVRLDAMKLERQEKPVYKAFQDDYPTKRL